MGAINSFTMYNYFISAPLPPKKYEIIPGCNRRWMLGLAGVPAVLQVRKRSAQVKPPENPFGFVLLLFCTFGNQVIPFKTIVSKLLTVLGGLSGLRWLEAS